MQQAVLSALASPVRRSILWSIWNSELSASDIAAAVGLGSSTVSQHLAILRNAELIELRREGTYRFYRTRQTALRDVQRLLGDDPARWLPLDRPTPSVHKRVARVIELSVAVGCDQSTAFRAFTKPEIGSRWLGSTVEGRDGRFDFNIESRLDVRGHFDVVVAPSLIALSWAFGPDVPLPSTDLRAYIWFTPYREHCSVLVQQMAHDEQQHTKLARMWSVVLDRFRTYANASLA